MENKEYWFSGYCRQIDQSRKVLVETCDGELDVGCGYATCPYTPNCTVAQKIKELEK